MPLVEEGRAKVNLTLRVIGRRVDGYHDLESLVAFADCADRLTLAPGAELKLITTGPLAGDCGETSDNLVLRAARLLAERVPGLKLGEFTLDKVLPIAAGIGGGSADAAAALRLLARLNGLAPDDPRLLEVALLTGARRSCFHSPHETRQNSEPENGCLVPPQARRPRKSCARRAGPSPDGASAGLRRACRG